MISLNPTTTATRTATEFNSSANPYSSPVAIVPADITWVISNTAIATVSWDVATSVATFTGVAVGQTVVTVTDTVNHVEATDTVEVIAAPIAPTQVANIVISFVPPTP